MNMQMLKVVVATQNSLAEFAGVARKRFGDESGEVGSYLILAAGLVAGAVAAAALLKGYFTDKATDITSQ